jgi:hypothetical protein
MVEVYFSSVKARDTVRDHLHGVRREMVEWVAEATETVKEENMKALKDSGKTHDELDAIDEEATGRLNMYRMDDGGTVNYLNDFIVTGAWGLQIPERLFWEGERRGRRAQSSTEQRDSETRTQTQKQTQNKIQPYAAKRT